jgi:hypothetical protein
VVKIENARLPRRECKFLSNNSFRWVHHREGNYLARGAKKAVSWRTFSLRHQIHTHHFLSGRERIHPSRSWKSGAENALRDARSGNQLLLLSRTRSCCIARGGAAKLIYSLLLFTRAHLYTAKFKRANFLRLCTTWMVGADVKSAAKASRRLMPPPSRMADAVVFVSQHTKCK